MTQRLSDKIKVLSLLATVMVVYRHALNYLAFFGTWTAGGLNGWVQEGCMVLTQVAVPYFFIVSGFFFLGHAYATSRDYGQMVRKKWHTLAVPFLVWNGVGALCLLLSGEQGVPESFGDALRRLAWSEYYGPLWYVRDLMTLMVLVPAYQWVFRWNRTAIYVGLFVLLYRYWLPVDCGWLSREGLLFFFLGGWLRQHEGVLERRLPLGWVLALGALWLVLCFTTPCFQYLHKPCTLLGIAVCWMLYEHCPALSRTGWMRMAQYSFFIYVTHFYVIKTMKVLLGRWFFGNEWVSLAAYLLLPLVTCALLYAVGVVVKRRWPKGYRIVTGNR